MRTFLTLLLITSSATAAPVTWTIDSMSFYFTGGRAYGSFDYDASTNQFSNINITTTHADGREYITYQYLNPGGLDPYLDGLRKAGMPEK